MSGSPELLHAFLRGNALWASTTLTDVEREVVVLTVAARNGCEVCVAMHTADLRAAGGTAELAAALVAGEPVPDSRLDTLRTFTLAVLREAGGVAGEHLQALAARGYTAQNALEVVLGVGLYTMSTFANRLTKAPVDAQFLPV